MKLRGTAGGHSLLLEPGDTAESIQRQLTAYNDKLATDVTIEIAGDTHPEALETAIFLIRVAGGKLGRIRAPRITVSGPSATLNKESEEPTKPVVPSTPVAFQNQRKTDDPMRTQTVILPHTVRAGFRGEYHGSVVVVGDVNPGAELVAAGDVIVTGILRGVVHAGCNGRPDAIVWGRPIASAQIRIGDSLARAPEGSSNMRRSGETQQAERAYLKDGRIIIDAER